MGLDIYLDDLADPKPHFVDHDVLCKDLGIPSHYKDRTDEANEQLRAEQAKRQAEIDRDFASRVHPEHTTSNRRYLRSSYNGGGFDAVVKNLVGRDLAYIFEPPEDYEWEPTKEDLALARKRAEEVRDALTTTIDLRVSTESATSLFAGQSLVTEERVLGIVRDELARERPHFIGGSYSNSKGAFYLDKPLEVIALVPGVDVFGKPAIHVVCRPDEDNSKYYRDMADVVIEFIDEALAMERPQISWSG